MGRTAKQRGRLVRGRRSMAAVTRIRRGKVRVVTDVHVNPNAGHREIWLRDADGYLVVLAGA